MLAVLPNTYNSKFPCVKMNCAPVSDYFVQIFYFGGLTVPCSDSLREKTLFVSCCFGKRCSASPAKGKESKRFVSGVRGPST